MDACHGFKNKDIELKICRALLQYKWLATYDHICFSSYVQVAPERSIRSSLTFSLRPKEGAFSAKYVFIDYLFYLHKRNISNPSIFSQPCLIINLLFLQFTRRPSSRRHSHRIDPHNSDPTEKSDPPPPDVVRSPVVLSSLANGSLKRHPSSGQR